MAKTNKPNEDLEAEPETGESPDGASDDSATRVRVCRKCATQATTNGDYCPHCGASYLGESRVKGALGGARSRIRGISPKARKIVIVSASILLLLIVAGGIAAKVASDNASADRARAAQAIAVEDAAAEEEAAQAQAEAETEQANAEAELRKARRSAVRSLQKAVTSDAQENVDSGLLEGPIIRTSCQAVGGGSTDDLDESTTKFECLAINEERSGGQSRGYPYDATMNWDEGSYTWQLQN